MHFLIIDFLNLQCHVPLIYQSAQLVFKNYLLSIFIRLVIFSIFPKFWVVLPINAPLVTKANNAFLSFACNIKDYKFWTDWNNVKTILWPHVWHVNVTFIFQLEYLQYAGFLEFLGCFQYQLQVHVNNSKETLQG